MDSTAEQVVVILSHLENQNNSHDFLIVLNKEEREK